MKHSLVVFALMAMSGMAFAEGFSYSYVQATYGTVDVDSGVFSEDGDGLGLKGSFGITDNLHIVGSYQKVDLDLTGDVDFLTAGLGVNAPVTEMIDVVGSVSFVDLEAPGFSDDGFELAAGVRVSVTSLVEIDAGITYQDLDLGGDDTGFGGGVLFNVTDSIALGLAASWLDDVSQYSATARWYFGK